MLKLRYKTPDGDTSALIAAAVPSRSSMTPALGFAAAVAEFGMLLRDSEHKGTSSFPGAAELARTFKGDDPHGHRAELIRLIEAAAGVRSAGSLSMHGCSFIFGMFVSASGGAATVRRAGTSR